MNKYQGLLIVSFGGPEKRDDVIPFLRNVLRGKNVPESRLAEVAEHYYHFDGISPINDQNRRLIAALQEEFSKRAIELPVYLGNRNWKPYLEDTLRLMKEDGVTDSLAFFTSAYSCYSGCRQYRENIQEARGNIGDSAPQVHKLRMFFNHPLFIQASTDRLATALADIPDQRKSEVRVAFTAHSIPTSMANGCSYTRQLVETCRLVAEQAGVSHWDLVYQSRSGAPSQPWLEPDINDHLKVLAEQGVDDVIIMPVGFLSDHMEVLFDLDTEAQETCESLGINMIRAKTVGVHPLFINMIGELVLERMHGTEKRAIGLLPPSHDVCPKDCCLSGR